MTQRLSAPTRREVLYGLGALIALPTLESLLPRSARASAAAPAPRFVNYYTPLGYNLATFVPPDTGNGYTLSESLKPLAPHRTRMRVLVNLNNEDPQFPMGRRAGDHTIGTSSYATFNRLLDPPGGQPATNAKSADQYAADALVVPGNRIKSLQITINNTPPGGGDYWPPLFTATNSWASATSPNTYLDNPVDVFRAIFGDDKSSADMSAGPSTVELARAAARKSVLDTTLAQTALLKTKLGALDAMKLDQYLTQLRAVELQVASVSPSASCTNPGTGSLSAPTLDARYKVMLNLAALALQCDATRVVNFMAGHGGSDLVFSHLGISDIWHNISHHNDDPIKLGQLTTIMTYQMQQLSAFLSQLNASPGLDGKTLLDNTILVSASEMSNPSLHDHKHMPVLLVGGSNVGMDYQGGSCVAYSDAHSPYLASMWLTLLDKFNAAPAGGLGNMTTSPITARLDSF